MDYKGYKIYACVERAELWTINAEGEPDEFDRDCPQHGDAPIVYEVYDGMEMAAKMAGSLEGVKRWIDEHPADKGVAA